MAKLRMTPRTNKPGTTVKVTKKPKPKERKRLV